MRKFVAIILMLIAPVCLAIEGLTVELPAIYKLMIDRSYPEALSAIKTYFDESRNIQSLSAVRASFGLSTWKQLADVYPPAKDALDALASDLQEKVNSGTATSEQIHEYIAVNGYSNHVKNTVQSFELYDKKYPEKIRSFFIYAKEQLIAEQRYDLLKKYYTDPIYEYEGARNMRELNIHLSREKNSPIEIEKANQDFNTKVNNIINLAVSLGLNDAAKEIRARADNYLKYYSTGKFIDPTQEKSPE